MSTTTQTVTALDLIPCLLNSGLRSSMIVTKDATKEVELKLTKVLYRARFLLRSIDVAGIFFAHFQPKTHRADSTLLGM
jgi:hypothetical protein